MGKLRERNKEGEEGGEDKQLLHLSPPCHRPARILRRLSRGCRERQHGGGTARDSSSREFLIVLECFRVVDNGKKVLFLVRILWLAQFVLFVFKYIKFEKFR